MADIEKNMALCALYDKYAPLLSEKKRRAFELYFWDDYSLSEVAYHTKTSRQAVRDLINRATEELEHLESELGLASSAEKTLRILDECTSQLEMIRASLKEDNEDNSHTLTAIDSISEKLAALRSLSEVTSR